MSVPSPLIEVLPQRPFAEPPYHEQDSAEATRGKQRLRIFLPVVIMVCLVGWTTTWLRPAIYQSTATLVITTPPDAVNDNEHSEISQRVSLHSHILTSRAVLEQLHGRLADDTAAPENISALREMLTVTPASDSNMVELRAEGGTPGFLPILVNSWIDTYLTVRSASQAQSSDSELSRLQQQGALLDGKIHTDRMALDEFRRANNIISLGQNETQVLARLKGISNALNSASEDKVKAEANLNAIKQAMANSRPVGGAQDRTTLSVLETRAVQLREELRDMQQRFTPTYMRIDPNAMALKEKLSLVEEKINNQRTIGAGTALSEAEQALISARHRVQVLKREITDYKQVAAEFTTRLAEHEKRKEELSRLEELHHDVQTRIAQIQTRNERGLPQVEVIEYATLPVNPVRPHYFRDSGLVFVSALALGLMAIWLYEFLTRIPRTSPASPRNVFYGISDPRIFPNQSGTHQAIATPPAPALEQGTRRELSEAEIHLLIGTSEPVAAAVICMLLSGLELSEVLALEWEDISLPDGTLELPGTHARTISLSNGAIAHLEKLATGLQDHKGHLLKDPEGSRMTAENLESLITCAVYDAGLAHPTEVTAATLRHTYLAYLARQGLRLAEMSRFCGPIPAESLREYSSYSRPGSNKGANEIDAFYPAIS